MPHAEAALPTRVVSRPIVVAYAAAIAGGEGLVATRHLTAGIIVHAVTLAAVINHAAWFGARTTHSADLTRRTSLLAALALQPLLRISSLTIPERETPVIAWYGLVGALLLVSVFLMLPALGLRPSSVGLRTGSWPIQASIGLAGIPLGLGLYKVLTPRGLGFHQPWQVVVAAITLFVFVGVTEEIVFRGMLQSALLGLLGWAGIPLGIAMYACAYASSRSIRLIAAAAVVGSVSSWIARRTGSILGIAVAHGFVSAGVLVVWPRIL